MLRLYDTLGHLYPALERKCLCILVELLNILVVIVHVLTASQGACNSKGVEAGRKMKKSLHNKLPANGNI